MYKEPLQSFTISIEPFCNTNVTITGRGWVRWAKGGCGLVGYTSKTELLHNITNMDMREKGGGGFGGCNPPIFYKFLPLLLGTPPPPPTFRMGSDLNPPPPPLRKSCTCPCPITPYRANMYMYDHIYNNSAAHTYLYAHITRGSSLH